MTRYALSFSALGLALISSLVACQPPEECGEESNCLEVCAELDAEACDASVDCTPIQGKELLEEDEALCLDFAVEFEDLGCMPAESGCTDAEVFAVDADGVGYYFSNGCIPDGFEALADDVGECAQGD